MICATGKICNWQSYTGNRIVDDPVVSDMEAAMRSTQVAFITAFGCLTLSLSIGASGAFWFIQHAERPIPDKLSKIEVSKMEERKAEVLKTEGETAVAPRVVAAVAPVELREKVEIQQAETVAPNTLMAVTAQTPVSVPTPVKTLPAVQATASIVNPTSVSQPAPKVKVASAFSQKVKRTRKVQVTDSDEAGAPASDGRDDYRSSERGTVLYRTYRPAGGRAYIVRDDDED
jgi:hypothetical protein